MVDKRRLVWIRWLDSGGSSHRMWENTDTLVERSEKDNLECESVGWIIHENEIGMTVAGHRAESTDNWEGVLIIPKCSILEIIDIKDL